MEKSEVKAKLVNNYQQFINYVDDLSLDEYDFAPEGKWTAGQQADHLIRSTAPLVSALGLPKLALKLKFGKANRASKSYEELVEKYQLKLEQGGKSFGKYNPPTIDAKLRKKKSKQLHHKIHSLCTKLEQWTEEDLDNYILPHPLLGKVTIREILYFTAYHAYHHQLLIKNYLKGV